MYSMHRSPFLFLPTYIKKIINQKTFGKCYFIIRRYVLKLKLNGDCWIETRHIERIVKVKGGSGPDVVQLFFASGEFLQVDCEKTGDSRVMIKESADEFIGILLNADTPTSQ